MSIPETIRTDIPAAADPRNLDSLAEEFVIGEAAGSPVHHDGFAKARALMVSLHNTSAILADADKGLHQRDGAKISTPDADRLRRGATAKLESVRKATGETLETIATHRQQVEVSIGETLGIPLARTSVTDSQRASDVRSALRSMAQADRLTAIRRAITDGDTEAVASIFAASPIASGLTADQAKLLRMEAENKLAPRQARLRASLDRVRTVLQRASAAVDERFGAMAGVGSTKAAHAERALRALEENK